MSRGDLARDVAGIVAEGVTVAEGAVSTADDQFDAAIAGIVAADVDSSGLRVVLAWQCLMTLNAYPPLAGLVHNLDVAFGHRLHLPGILGRRPPGSPRSCVSPSN